MASFYQSAKLTGLGVHLQSAANSLESYRDVYESNRHRIFALSFWMTDNEIEAEQLTANVFLRVFSRGVHSDPESVDKALIAELQETVSVGDLSLQCGIATEVAAVRRSAKRIELERAVFKLPPTERLVFVMHDVERYDHARIGRTLGLTEEESKAALHQSRLKIRELLSKTSF